MRKRTVIQLREKAREIVEESGLPPHYVKQVHRKIKKLYRERNNKNESTASFCRGLKVNLRQA